MSGKTLILIKLVIPFLWMGFSPLYGQTPADENRMAAGYYSRQQWDESATAFQALIRNHPGSLEASVAHFFLGESLMQTGNFSEAYREFQQYLVKNPGTRLGPRATFRMGEAAFEIRNDASAIRLLEAFVKENQGHELSEFALPMLAEARLRRLEPLLAQAAFLQAIDDFPDGQLIDRCLFGLAKSYHLLGKPQQAIDSYQAIANDANHPRASEADVRIAQIFLANDDIDSAIMHFERAVEQARTPEMQIEASYWTARAIAHSGDERRALTLLSSIIETHLKDAGDDNPIEPALASAVYYDAALLASKQKLESQGFEYLNTLLVRYPESDLADDALFLRVGVCAASDETVIRSQTELFATQFLKAHPKSEFSARVQEQLGRFYLAEKSYEKSIETFERLLNENKTADPRQAARDRNNWTYLQSLGLMGQSRFVEAESKLSSIVFGSASEELAQLSQLGLATARYGQKKFSAAIPGYQSYVAWAKDRSDRDPAIVFRAWNELTLSFVQAGLWKEAIEAYRELTALQFDSQKTVETGAFLANRAIESGQSLRAAELLERLVGTDSDAERLPKYLSSLGWIRYETGDVAQAEELFRRLIEEFPGNDLTGPAAMALGKKLETEKQLDRAADMYGLVVRNFRDKQYSQIARLRRADIIQKSGEAAELDEALDLLQEYLDFQGEKPALDEALYQMGWLLIQSSQKEKAMVRFQQLLDQCPNSKFRADVLVRLAHEEAAKKQFSEASQKLMKLVEDRDVLPVIRFRALYLLSEIAAKQNQWETAIRWTEKLVAETNDEVQKRRATYWLAEAAYQTRDFQKSESHFSSLRENHQGLSAELLPWIWLRQAQTLGQLKNWTLAKKYAEEGREKFASFDALFEFDYLIARGLEDQGRLDDARERYLLVVNSPAGRATETAAMAQWRIGENYFHQERFADAIEAFYLVDSNYAYAEWRCLALLQAGKCQENLKNWQHAKKLYMRLMDQFPDSQHKDAAELRIKGLEKLISIDNQRAGKPSTKKKH